MKPDRETLVPDVSGLYETVARWLRTKRPEWHGDWPEIHRVTRITERHTPEHWLSDVTPVSEETHLEFEWEDEHGNSAAIIESYALTDLMRQLNHHQ